MQTTFKLKARKIVELPDGKYTGKVSALQVRTSDQGYDYLDIIIDVDGHDTTTKYGVPFSLSNKTKLGALLVNADPKLEQAINEEKEIDIEKVLVGRALSFVVFKEGEWTRVVDKSVNFL